MLSILIPTYNCQVIHLVEEIHKQATSCKIEFEILVYDDCSELDTNKINKKINTLNNCTFKVLPKNIGRSAIRNLLSKNAKFNNLLFVDAGTFPSKNTFVKKYLGNLIDSDVIVGGMSSAEESPIKTYRLRWIYTKKRESKKGLHSCNFLIKKEILVSNPFDESLNGYGYEDVLFFEKLKSRKIEIKKIDNTVIHTPDDDAVKFIKKNENAIKNLIYIIDTKKLKYDVVGISKYYFLLKKLKLDYLTSLLFHVIKPFLILNLTSYYPSLFLYDFYRLGFYCSLKNKK